MARIKNKVPGRKGAVARIVILLFFVIIGLLASILTLPEYIQKLGAERAIPEAFAGCAVLFLVGEFFWGLIKWIGWMGKKSFAAARWFWDEWPVFTIFGLVLKGPICLVIAMAPPMLYGLLFAPLYSITYRFALNGVSLLGAMALFAVSGVIALGMLFWDIRTLARKQ